MQRPESPFFQLGPVDYVSQANQVLFELLVGPTLLGVVGPYLLKDVLELEGVGQVQKGSGDQMGRGHCGKA